MCRAQMKFSSELEKEWFEHLLYVVGQKINVGTGRRLSSYRRFQRGRILRSREEKFQSKFIQTEGQEVMLKMFAKVKDHYQDEE